MLTAAKRHKLPRIASPRIFRIFWISRPKRHLPELDQALTLIFRIVRQRAYSPIIHPGPCPLPYAGVDTGGVRLVLVYIINYLSKPYCPTRNVPA